MESRDCTTKQLMAPHLAPEMASIVVAKDEAQPDPVQPTEVSIDSVPCMAILGSLICFPWMLTSYYTGELSDIVH